MQPHNLPRTGFDKLDNAVGRRQKSMFGLPVLRDPTLQAPSTRIKLFLSEDRSTQAKFKDIDEAYLVDSYARQGVDKYTELSVKQGWKLDCKTPEPVEYLERRFQIMSFMLPIPFPVLIAQLVNDYIKYSNAFWVKRRGRLPEPVPGVPDQGVFGSSQPVLGYFRIDPKKMFQVRSKDGTQIVGWEFRSDNGKPIPFKLRDVIHFAHNVQPGELLGPPTLAPVLEDIRSYRQVEEYVIKLLYKHLTPLLHHEVPDVSGTGQGRQEDVDAAAASHSVIAPDGLIVTPPGHKINYIGAESHSIRGEGYMKSIRERVFAGLGVNAVVMGEGQSTSAGSADAMTVTMHNRAKFYQLMLAEMLTQYVLFELLLEGGFDPTTRIDYVRWIWHEIETETLIKRENHTIQKYTNGLLTEDEARRELGHEPLVGKERRNTHVYRVKIPLVEAQAALKIPPAPSSDGPAKQADSRNRPANQHGTRSGPKVRPR